MKKIFKSRVFAFILGAILFGSIGVVSAYTILANDIGYTPSNTTWEVSNVKDAIDDLYSKNISIDKLLDSNIASGDTSTVTANYTNPNSTPEKIIVVLNWFSSNMGGSVSSPDISITGDISNLHQISDIKSSLSRYMYNYVYTGTLAGNGNISASLKGNGGASSYGGEYVSIYSVR